MNNTYELASEISHEASKQKEKIILDQLSELLNRGLLVWEEGEEMLTCDRDFRFPDKHIVTLRCSGRLVLKEKEYVEKLEAENKSLKEVINRLKAVF